MYTYVCVCNFYLISFLEINFIIQTLIKTNVNSVHVRSLSERLIYYITIQKNYHAKKIKLTF